MPNLLGEPDNNNHSSKRRNTPPIGKSSLIEYRNDEKQESPPAWTQEAYRPPRSKYSLCSPYPGVPPPPEQPGLGYPPGQDWEGTWDESLGYPPDRTCDQWKYYGIEIGVPPRKDMGPVDILWDGDRVFPRKDMGPVEVLWDRDGAPPPPGCELTNWNSYLPSSFGCGR